MQESKDWPKKPYRVYDQKTHEFLRGFTREEIKAAWERNGLDSNLRGTYAHLQFEKYFERLWDNPNTLDTPESTCDTSLPEWERFQYFVNHFVRRNGWEPRIPEMMIAEDYYVNINGFIDMVFYDPHKKGYILVDYKRCKQLKKPGESRFPKYGTSPLDDIEDCNFNHYTLQLNLARLVVEQAYGWKVTKMCLVNIHPNISLEREPGKIVEFVPHWKDAPRRITQVLRLELLQSLEEFTNRYRLPCPRVPIDQTESSGKRIWSHTLKDSVASTAPTPTTTTTISQTQKNDESDTALSPGSLNVDHSNACKRNRNTPTSLETSQKVMKMTNKNTSTVGNTRTSAHTESRGQVGSRETTTGDFSPTGTNTAVTRTTAASTTANRNPRDTIKRAAYHPQFPDLQ
jgi:hypothetical protein